VITLDVIDASNWRAALEVRVQPERLAWVASIEPVALILLAKCAVNPDGQHWTPFVVMSDGRAVGIVGIGVDASDAQTAWVHHLLIDEREQGHGFGRSTLRALAAWLRDNHPGVTIIGLNILGDNAVAFGLYLSLGFIVVAKTVDDQHIAMARVDEL
jgi:diamine N-acetyltransferase